MRRHHVLPLLMLLLLPLSGCIFGGSSGNNSEPDASGDADVSVQDGGSDADDVTDGGDNDAGDAGGGDAADVPPECGEGLELCDGACVDTSSSVDHCSECNNPCEVGDDNFAVACESSACTTLDTCVEGYVDLDGDADTGCECEITDPTDPPGDNTDTNCDGFDGNLEAAVFVSEGAGGDGSFGSPTGDLQSAVDEVAGDDTLTQVIVSQGTYSDGLSLQDGVTVAGGYSDDFQDWDPQSKQTVLEGVVNPSEAGELHTVEAKGVTSATLTGFKVLGTAPTELGASTVVIYTNGSDGLILRSLTLDGADATAGTDGQPAPTTDSTSCTPYDGGSGATPEMINPCNETSNQTSNPGRDGKPLGSRGTGGVGGNHRCSALPGVECLLNEMDGENGTEGKDGDPGSQGEPSTDGVGQLQNGHWVTVPGVSPGPGARGTGGGGGGAGGNCGTGSDPGEYDTGGAGGDGGRGGCGGAAGENGSSGGASILLLAIDTELTLDNVTGIPGRGGDGGEGSAGAAGESRQSSSNPGGSTGAAGAGGNGALGGAGGIGGHGAGGCGGPSYGVARDADSTITGGLNIDASTFDASQPGQGVDANQTGCGGNPGETDEDKLIPDAS